MATKRKTAKAALQGVGKPGKAAQFAKAPGWSAIRDRDKGREAVMPEHKGEDGLSSGYAQVRLIAAQREAYRNTVFSPATAQQLKVNVVGVPGGRLTFTTDDETFMEQASYLVITEELLSKRYVDYEKVIRVLDKRTLKLFINSLCKKIVILQGKIMEIDLKNGIVIKFLYE